ncbi:Uncharacterised protein [Mycobacterium tuberculosis]|uniref:Uncharacterized protein n=1 Tax=Mycobacterium tuberculosis TaxID=1773 RepID=A0A916P748_MYCTX|nr:Uncharacterised protein [Mycobacterium tuberculosis]COW81271.1 Uncharacterised protein [Mycobacterium tuberculosis]COX21280.1 Uncharacterised protein [Mycobacterium tuberculosis]COY01508.1 Uncharacterised protein [Mycobacterium tuberculosis]
MNAELWHRKRNRNETSLQHTHKGDDVFKALRGQYRDPITA